MTTPGGKEDDERTLERASARGINHYSGCAGFVSNRYKLSRRGEMKVGRTIRVSSDYRRE